MVKLILILLCSTLSFASLTDLDRSEIQPENIISNGGFEGGTAGWTASGVAAAVVSSGSNLLQGKNSVTWDSTAAAQTFSSKLIAVPNGLKARSGTGNCVIMTPSGTATHTLELYDGTTILATKVVTSSTTPVRSSITFTFPSSGSIRLRLVSVNANEPSITIDSCFLGLADRVVSSSGGSVKIVSAEVTSVTTTAVVRQDGSWISGVGDNGTGDTTLTVATGTFSSTPNCVCSEYSTGPGHCLIDSTTAKSSTLVRVNTFNSATTPIDTIFNIICVGVP